MNIDNDEFLIIDGKLEEYRGTGKDVIVPEGVTSISLRVIFENIDTLSLPKSLTIIPSININCNNFIIYDTTAFAINSSSHIEIKNIQIHNSNTKSMHDIFSNLLYTVKFDEISILDNPLVLNEGNKYIIEQFTELKTRINNLTRSDFLIIDDVLLACYSDEEEIIVPDGVREIGKYVFYNPKYQSIILPSTVLEISGFTFQTGQLLKKLRINPKCYFYEKKFPNIRLNELQFVAESEGDIYNFFVNTTFYLSCIQDIKSFHTKNTLVSPSNIESFAGKLGLNNFEFISGEYESEEKIVTTFEKGKYKSLLATTSNNRFRLDWKFANNVETIIIDNRSGTEVKSWINLLRIREGDGTVRRVCFPNLKQVIIQGNNASFLEKTQFVMALGHLVQFKFTELELSNEPKPTEKIQINDEEINELLDKIYGYFDKLTDVDVEHVKEKVERLLSKYQEDINDIKPSLSFKKEISLEDNTTNPTIIRIKLLGNLQLLLNRIMLDDEYSELRQSIFFYEKLFSSEHLEISNEVLTTDEKVEYIIACGKKFKNDKLLSKLRSLLDTTKIELSETISLTSDDIVLKTNDNIKLNFSTKVDDLYQEAKKVAYISEILYDSTKSELASDIETLNKIISSFNDDYKEEYVGRLNTILTKYFEILLNTKETEINKTILTLRSEWIPILEDIHNTASIYTVMGELNTEGDNNSLISNLVTELINLTNDSSIDDKTKEVILEEIIKIIEKWKQILPNYSFPEEKDELKEFIDNTPNLGYEMPSKVEVTDEVTKLQLSILKDLYSIEVTIMDYIKEYTNYKLVLESINKR